MNNNEKSTTTYTEAIQIAIDKMIVTADYIIKSENKLKRVCSHK